MNREYFSQSTKSVLMHLKSYNFKLCKKGLLERAVNMKIPAGEFDKSENEFFKNILKLNAVDEPLNRLGDDKKELMTKEIKKIEVTLEALNKTIKNIYVDVKSRMNEISYDMWINRVKSVSNKFKKLYSDTNNSLYNHFYKMSWIENNAWMNILSDVEWLKVNVLAKCEGGICKECSNCGALNMSSVSDRDKTVNKSKMQKSENVRDFVEGFEEGDLLNLFKIKGNNGKRCNSENDENKDYNKEIKRKKVEQDDGKDVFKEQIAENNAEYDDISEDESGMIDNILLQRVDDEVGVVDMNQFNEFIEKFVEKCVNDE